MTAQQKAVDLFNDYYRYLKANLMYDEEARQDAKAFALITVDEIISIKLLWYQKDTKELDYWKEVKQEIEKL